MPRRHRCLKLTSALVREHQGAVWRFLRFLGAQPAVADDLTQEAFLALARSEVEDRGAAATGGWLRTTARRLFLRQCEAGRSSVRPALQFLGEADLDGAWLEVQRACGDEDYDAALAHCFEALTPRARRALDLRYGEDASREDMAIALGMSGEGVKTLLRRARAQLHSCIKDQVRDDR